MIWLNGKQYKTHFNSRKNRPVNSPEHSAAIGENAMRAIVAKLERIEAPAPEVAPNALEA